MNVKNVISVVVPAVVWALPLGGFLFGFSHADPPGVASGLFIGLIFAVITPLSLGFPPQNEGGVGDPYNAWPHIGVAFLVICAVQSLRAVRKKGVAEQHSSHVP